MIYAFRVAKDWSIRPVAMIDATIPTPSVALLEYFDATMTVAF